MLFAFRNHNPVDDDVIHIRRADCAGKAQVIDLHRRGPLREHAHAMFAEPAIEVDQNVDAGGADFFGRFGIAQRADVDPMVKSLFQPCAHGAVVGAAIVDGRDFEAVLSWRS